MKSTFERSLKAIALCYCALLAAAMGCAALGGQSPFSRADRLLPEAENLAAAAPQPAPVARELQKSTIHDYYVEPGDVLLVEALDFDSPMRFLGDQTVQVDGTIDLGRYGRVRVAGLTLEQIESVVHHAVVAESGRVDPLTVRLIQPQGAVFYVLGEVHAPGAYPLMGRETVLDAIVAAGGLTDVASRCNIILSRPTHPDQCRVVLPVCYRQIVQLGDTTTNYQIRPGDRVFVASKTLWEMICGSHPRHDCKWCRGVHCPCPDPNMIECGPQFSPLPVMHPAPRGASANPLTRYRLSSIDRLFSGE